MALFAYLTRANHYFSLSITTFSEVVLKTNKANTKKKQNAQAIKYRPYQWPLSGYLGATCATVQWCVFSLTRPPPSLWTSTSLRSLLDSGRTAVAGCVCSAFIERCGLKKLKRALLLFLGSVFSLELVHVLCFDEKLEFKNSAREGESGGKSTLPWLHKKKSSLS